MTAFTFSQPFLIKTTIEFVGSENPNGYHGKGLIGAWTLVYLGLAVCEDLNKPSRFADSLRYRYHGLYTFTKPLDLLLS